MRRLSLAGPALLSSILPVARRTTSPAYQPSPAGGTTVADPALRGVRLGAALGCRAGGLTLAVVLLGGLLSPGVGHAEDLAECMTTRMQQVDDSLTIRELRLQCQKQLQSGEYVAETKPEAVVSRRLRKDRAHVLEPFTLMAHRPNYILVATHNFSGYDPAVYREQTGDPDFNIDDTES